LNTHMCEFESPEKDESRAHSADSWKAYSTLRAFNTYETKFVMSQAARFAVASIVSDILIRFTNIIASRVTVNV